MRGLPSRRHLLVGAAAAVALAAAGCGGNGSSGSAGSGASGEPITVGVLYDSTAYLKSLDSAMYEGIKAAVDKINKDGGVLGGRKFKIVAEDMAADPQKEVQAFQRVMSQDKPVAFLNGFSSAGNAAVASIAASQKKPMVVASVVPAQNADYVFSTLIPVRYETGTRVEYLKQQGITKVGILHDPTPYNKQQETLALKQLKDAGITVVGSEEHASDAVDLRPQVTKLLGGQPQAIMKLSTGPTQIVAAKALADAGSSIPLLFGLETSANLTQSSKAYGHILYVAAPLQAFDQIPDAERTDAMKSLMKAMPNMTDANYVGRGWDAAYILKNAIESAGSADGEKIQKALSTMKSYAGTSGTYQYTDKDHNGMPVNPNYLAQLQSDGSQKLVFTPSRQAAG